MLPFKSNDQKPEPRDMGDGTQIEVHSIFYTIQGEGPYSGMPAVFIRLAGCNLQCKGCDTEYTAKRQPMPLLHILDRVKSILPQYRKPLVVLTGGEPFRQNITKLAHGLISIGAYVQVETNGTFNPPEGFPPEVWIVCSPKAGKVATELAERVGSYKYVLDANHVDPNDGLPTSILGSEHAPARPPAHYRGRIFVSPMDVGELTTNQLNIVAATESCLKYGYTLNLQIHKIVGLP